VRVVIRKEWPTGWVENNPAMVFLQDGRRFIWESERNGWKNFYLYDLDGELIAPLTAHTTYEAATLVKVDEEAGLLFYTARGGDNHLKLQLYRAGLDGRDTRRLTDPAFHHTIGSCLSTPGPGVSGGGAYCGISPDNRYFVDVYQTHATPAAWIARVPDRDRADYNGQWRLHVGLHHQLCAGEPAQHRLHRDRRCGVLRGDG
jgi:dipeptidyl-peptidase 4